jgi:threonine/homoserine/homoserine lactone efflux protein
LILKRSPPRRILTTYQALLAFTLTAGFMTITPGLDTALVLRTAAVEGTRPALLASVGICCGCLTWGLAASVGVGALLAASHVAYKALRITGAGYLFFLGMKMLLRKHQPGIGREKAATEHENAVPVRASASRWFVRGLLTNLLNPKVGVFYVTFLPQFIPSKVAVTSFSVLLTSIHATEGLLLFCLLTVATRPLSRWLHRPYVVKSLDRTLAAVLVGFGFGLVFERRC